MFLPIQPELFFSKKDAEDIRLGDLAQNIYFDEVKADDVIIFGYPDDDGIKLNGGRIGAAEAPRLIRQFLYKMTPSYKKAFIKNKIYDYGDLALTVADLEMRHEVARKHILKCLAKNVKTISLGGGHDYGFSDIAAFIEHNFGVQKQKPLILNFDAHLDVRPPKNGPNSGTPFYRLQEAYKNKFNLIEIGIQPQCNSPHHYRWAKEQGIEIVDLETLEHNGWTYLWTQTELKNLTPERPVFISFDIDALTASEAGGCSQAWATGLKTSECLAFLSEVYHKSRTRGLGIYEVSPPLDRDFQTSKTAALIAHHFIFNS